jgi:hypothetical protein
MCEEIGAGWQERSGKGGVAERDSADKQIIADDLFICGVGSCVWAASAREVSWRQGCCSVVAVERRR